MTRNWRRYLAVVLGLLCWLPVAAQAEPSPSAQPAVTCPGQATWGFETLSTSWNASTGVRTNSPDEQPHSGSWYAWLDGYGMMHTDTMSNSISVPAGCLATLTFWLHIDTAETTTTTTAYDTLTLKANTTVVGRWSNLNHNLGYAQHSLTLSSGVWDLVFTGTEDSSLQTSFTIDDIALTSG